MSPRYQTMPPDDFRSALEEAGLACSDFAAIADEPIERIRRMMFGLEKVPYRLSLLATLLTLSQARELALLHAEVAEPEEAYSEPSWTPGFLTPSEPAENV